MVAKLEVATTRRTVDAFAQLLYTFKVPCSAGLLRGDNIVSAIQREEVPYGPVIQQSICMHSHTPQAQQDRSIKWCASTRG